MIRANPQPSLRSFVSRGVRNFGVPVALFSTTIVFLTTEENTWRDMLSLKYLLTVLTAVAVGTVMGALYGWIMWTIFARQR